MAARKKVKKAGKPKTAKPKAAKAMILPAGQPQDAMVALATAVPPPEKVILAKVGDSLTLTVAVTNAVVPCAVSHDGRIKLFGLVSQASTFDAGAKGLHIVGWAFNELAASNWTHRLTARVNAGPEVVLLDGSAAAGDDGFATGHATVVVS